MCSGLKYGSNNNFSGSTFIGDCLRPLLHIFHCGLIRPQNAGPETAKKYLCYISIIQTHIRQITITNLFAKYFIPFGFSLVEIKKTYKYLFKYVKNYFQGYVINIIYINKMYFIF